MFNCYLTPAQKSLFQTSRQILCKTDTFVQCFYIYAVNMCKYLRVLNVSSKLISAGLIAAIIAVFEFPPVLKKKEDLLPQCLHIFKL